MHREAPDFLNQYPFFEYNDYRGHDVATTFPNIGHSNCDNSGRFTFFHVSTKLEDVPQRDGQVVCMDTFLYIRLDGAGRLFVASFLGSRAETLDGDRFDKIPIYCPTAFTKPFSNTLKNRRFASHIQNLIAEPLKLQSTSSLVWPKR